MSIRIGETIIAGIPTEDAKNLVTYKNITNCTNESFKFIYDNGSM